MPGSTVQNEVSSSIRSKVISMGVKIAEIESESSKTAASQRVLYTVLFGNSSFNVAVRLYYLQSNWLADRLNVAKHSSWLKQTISRLTKVSIIRLVLYSSRITKLNVI